MNICPQCGRTFGPGASVCAYDQSRLVPIAEPTKGSMAGQVRVGDVLGSYRILDQIAAGGMGTIFGAEHIRIRRKVALKVLKPDLLSNKAMVHRFFEEARAVNEIGHDNIVDIIDFVEDYDADPPLVYMVMELLAGQDLRTCLSSVGALNPDDAVNLISQIAATLAVVHQYNILHRDLKPENIFLLRPKEDSRATDEAPTNVWVGQPGAQTRIKLLDFGVVCYFGKRGRIKMTEPGLCVGTPEYMAPEQILGRDLDERADIYSLGLVLYEMLVGRPPFFSENAGEVLVHQVREEPAPISASRRQEPPVSPVVEEVVMRCLEKRPADRFRNIREFHLALRQAMKGKNIPSLEEDTSGVFLFRKPADPEGAAEDRSQQARITVPPLSKEEKKRQEAEPFNADFVVTDLVAIKPQPEVMVTKRIGDRRGFFLGPLVLILLAGGIALWWFGTSKPEPTRAGSADAWSTINDTRSSAITQQAPADTPATSADAGPADSMARDVAARREAKRSKQARQSMKATRKARRARKRGIRKSKARRARRVRRTARDPKGSHQRASKKPRRAGDTSGTVNPFTNKPSTP